MSGPVCPACRYRPRRADRPLCDPCEGWPTPSAWRWPRSGRDAVAGSFA